MLLERPAEVDRVDLVRKGWPGVPCGRLRTWTGFAPNTAQGPYKMAPHINGVGKLNPKGMENVSLENQSSIFGWDIYTKKRWWEKILDTSKSPVLFVFLFLLLSNQ